MRKRLIKKFTKAKEGSFGYSLTELLVVIAIIAILVAIAIPSIFAISRALKFKRVNDHAKSIFMAAQQNLTDMRSDGELSRLRDADGAGVIPDLAIDPDLEAFKSEYVYTVKGRDAFNLMLPAGSVEAEAMSGQIVVEYNPFTGNVFAVFYSEEDDQNIAAEYADPTGSGLPRDKDARKDRMLGYYDGTGLNSSKLDWEETAATVKYVDGEEGIVQVWVPVPADFYGSLDKFAQALDIVLTVTSEFSVSESAQPVEIPIKDTSTGLSSNCYIESGNTVVVEFPIDSLVQYGSFANHASGTQKGSNQASVATLTDESCFKILPGENITIQADVTVDMDVSDVLVKVSPGIIANINPMFAFMQASSTGVGYDLGVANGRHLQNLNVIAPTLADQVVNVMFTRDVDWNATVSYYNDKYEAGETYHTGTPVRNADGVITGYTYNEAPARALPYFVPIHNASLFGTATFIYPGDDDDGMGGWLQQLLEAIKKIGEILYGGFLNDKVPTLTDELDAVQGNSHATIQGAGHKVYNLNIDSTLYGVPAGGKFYTTGEHQEIDYNFTGLFGYVNTAINGLEVVNPVVKGRPIVGKSNPATGALVGAAGYNTVITNCGVYVDKNASGYIGQYLGHKAYNANIAQTWYGVSGEGAVGGLVGYAKSHRTIQDSAENNGELLPSEDVLAFSYSFAAVPVSGNMRTGAAKDYGYSNGIGAFIGNSQLTNFYSCYASGDVIANNCYITTTTIQGVSGDSGQLFGTSIELPYDGRKSWGAGGFVGTSHGTRYTNCFATGDVTAASAGRIARGAGGFVGFMSIDETSAYGNESTEHNGSGNKQIVQRTVFTNCYSVGLATNGGRYENFSGANGRIVLDLDEFFTYFIGDYYRLYAPYRSAYETRDPSYGDSAYLYRDTYYLNYGRKTSDDLDKSRTCAEPIQYSYLENLIGAHTNKSTWAQEELKRIKNIKLVGDFGLLKYITYNVIYFNNALGWGYSKGSTALENLYYARWDEGYDPDEWESATAATTHPYTTSAGGAVYPFTKLKGMDYYGDWPAKPSDIGMAYYEEYDGDENRYYLFDKEYTEDSRLTLKDGETDIVVEDGYAIFSINSIKSVTAGGETFTIANKGLIATDDVFSLEDQNFKAYLLSEDFLELQPAKGEFYIEVKVLDNNNKTYTMYVNPNTARTHVNPTNGKNNAQKPDSAPTIQYIRSARQLKAMSNMDSFLTDDYRYIQQLNINATKYNGWDSSHRKLASIGSAQNPFNASYGAGYTNAAGEPMQYAVTGFQLESSAAGMFEVIGKDGSVESLILNFAEITAGGAAENAAVLAGRNEGSVYNVDMTITDAVSLTAQNNAGLLAGYNSGTFRNCEVSATAVTLKAENCGGLIGSAVGTEKSHAEVTGCKLALTGTLNAFADSEAGTKYAGGLIGYGEYLTLTGAEPWLTMTGMNAQAEYAGGLAGYLKESDIRPTDTESQVTMHVTGTLSNPKGYMAGFLGGGENVSLNSADVTVKAVAGKKAAGFLGAGTGINAANCEVVVSENGSVIGSEQAAGVACSIGTGSYFSYVPVTLKNVTVSAENGDAAGYAVEATAETDINDCCVTLGGAAKIRGSKTAAGFIGKSGGYVLHTAGSTTYNSVVGHGEISAPSAAGFACEISGQVNNAHVSSAVSNDNYLGNSESNLKVTGTDQAAGFAVHVAKNAVVQNSYALNEISGTAASGFVITNEGNINGCMANVSIYGGHAFVADNKGSVSRSYGWYNNKGTTATVSEVKGDCVSAYFADRKPVDDEGQIATLYTADGQMQKLTVSELQGAVNLLANTANKWYTSGYNAYPYSRTLAGKTYQYPMLRDHYGDWLTAPQYAFGIAYYETYKDGDKSITKIHMVDLSDSSQTKEGKIVAPYVRVENGTVVSVSETNILNNEYTIDTTGYAVFGRKGNNVLKSLCQGNAPLFTYSLDNNEQKRVMEYEFYALNTASAYNGIVAVEAALIPGGTAEVNLYFADAVNPNGTFYVRTPAQLEKIGTASGANFHQTHDITVSDFANVQNLSGTYNGYAAEGVKLTVTGQKTTWLSEVSGSVQNLNLELPNAVNAPVFGKINSGASVTLTGLRADTIGAKGALAETVSGSMTIPDFETDSVAGKLFGDSNGSITAGAITVSADAAQLFGKVKNVTVQGDITVGGAVGTQVFADVSGTVSTKAINVTGSAAKIFGNVTGGSVTVTGKIDTGAATRIFAAVDAPVTVIGGIEADSAEQVFGAATKKITTGDINITGNAGTVFNAVTDVEAANITVGGTVTQVFGEVTGTGVEVSGKIDTGAATRIFSAVDAPVTVTGGIEADSAEQVFGAATAKITTGDINITGNTGTVFNAVTDVEAANITVGGTVTQVFGAVTGTGVDVTGKITVNGNADKIFDSVKAPVSVKQGISTEYTVEGQAVRGDVGQVFGAITLGQNKTVDVKGITVGNITGNGLIASVGAANDANAGTITLGAVNVKDVGTSGTTTAKLIGNVKGGAVTTTSITAGNVYGSVFGDVDATVTTGNISVTTLSAQLAGTVKGTLQGTESTTKATISLGSTLGNLVTKVDTNAVLKNYSVINVESITNNVIPSVAGTVQNFAVTATTTGTMSAPLVGNELTGTLNAVTVDVHSAAVTTNNGILVNSVNASASVIGCRVEADEVSSSAATFGGLTGTNKGTLTGNTVTIGTMTATGTEAIVGGLVGNNSGKIAAFDGQKVTADTATQVSITTLSGGKTVGGLVGTNSGTINCSNTVKTVNVTISTNAAKVGGLTGVNTGTIAGTDVTASISYTGSGGTTIGGIVGEMNGGTLNGAKAGGSITAKEGQNGKANIIGGAVGKDVGNATPAVYSNVHSTVKVAAAWANGTTKSVTVPGGMGAVGKFVGYVNNGSFTNCSGMDNSTDFWFMGELAAKTNESYKLASDGYALTSETTKFPTITSYQTANARSEWIATNGRAKDTVYVHYAVTKLEGCTFDLKSVAGTHTVTLGKEYYHTGETRDITYYSANKVTPANPFTSVNGLTYSTFASDKDTTVKTDYYLNVNGNYYPMYAKYETEWTVIVIVPVEVHKVTLYADTNMNGAVDSNDWSNSKSNAYSAPQDKISNVYAYTRPDALAAGTYLIVNGDANQALGMEGTTVSSIAISSANGSVAFNDIEQASLVKNGIWTLAVNEDGTYTWKRGANYLNVTESGISGTSSAVSMGADVLIPNPTAYNFRTSGGYSLTYADGAFKQTGSAGQVSLFKVNAPNGPVYELLINSYVGYGELCGYSTAKAAALSEETIPAEEIGGETGNNT